MNSVCFEALNHTVLFTGIPTDEEQATGLEKVIMKAMKQGEVRPTHRNSDIMCSRNMKNIVFLKKKTAVEKEERDADSS